MAPQTVTKTKNANPIPTKPAKQAKGEGEAEADEDSDRTTRVAYLEDEAAKADLNAEGKLKCVPTAFDGSLHLTPRKGDFADEADFLDFRAAQAESRVNELIERAARDRETATNIRKYGDPAQRAAIAKRQKLLAEVAALEQGLVADGVELPPAPLAARKAEKAETNG